MNKLHGKSYSDYVITHNTTANHHCKSQMTKKHNSLPIFFIKLSSNSLLVMRCLSFPCPLSQFSGTVMKDDCTSIHSIYIAIYLYLFLLYLYLYILYIFLILTYYVLHITYRHSCDSCEPLEHSSACMYHILNLPIRR